MGYDLAHVSKLWDTLPGVHAHHEHSMCWAPTSKPLEICSKQHRLDHAPIHLNRVINSSTCYMKCRLKR